MILFDAPRRLGFGLVYWGLTPQQQPGSYQGGRLGLRPTSFHSNDHAQNLHDFIEIEVDFIEKKVRKIKNIFFKHGPITLPYKAYIKP